MYSLYFLAVRMLREELQLLQEQGSYVGEVVKPMDKKKVLVKVNPQYRLKNKNITANIEKAKTRTKGKKNALISLLMLIVIRLLVV